MPKLTSPCLFLKKKKKKLKEKKKKNRERRNVSAATSSMIFSGIQPSGRLHLGNYLGAVRNWIRFSRESATKNLYSVVDLHAMTQSIDGATIRAGTREMTVSLLACGLEVDNAHVILFPQSAVREHSELAWLLSCQTPLGKLQRMTQYKNKSVGAKASSNLGLLSYPVLQAADILLYRATHVPVGEDQHQHLELAREIAEGANAFWKNEFFPVPATLSLPTGARIMSLKDGTVKMSKSHPDDASRINMDDSDDAIAAKIKAAKTDSELGFWPLDPKSRPEKANLVRILGACRTGSRKPSHSSTPPPPPYPLKMISRRPLWPALGPFERDWNCSEGNPIMWMKY